MSEAGKPSVLVIGEALIDMVVQYGDSDDKAQAVPGGSPANVALALGRLGIPVELVAWIGQDDFSDMILEHLSESNVVVDDAWRGASETPKAIARLNESNAASYEFILEWDPSNIKVPESAVIVHTGSIGAVLKPGYKAVIEALDAAKGQALISYDPNSRPQIMTDKEHARETIEAIASRADVIKSSDEDLEWLYPGVPAEDSALRWIEEYDIPFFVLTRGKDGPKAWLGKDVCKTAVPADVKVVDTVGAGDTFMGGLLDSLYRRRIYGAEGRDKLRSLAGDDLQAILNEAAALSDIVVQRRGANPPWASELGR